MAAASAPGTNVACSSTGPAGHGATVTIDRAETGLGPPYCYAGGNADGHTQGVATNGSNPGANGLSPGCDTAHPGYDGTGLTLHALAGVGITAPTSPARNTPPAGPNSSRPRRLNRATCSSGLPTAPSPPSTTSPSTSAATNSSKPPTTASQS